MNATQVSPRTTSSQPERLLYTAKAHTTGGRDGGASLTSDGRLDLRFSPPNGPDDGTNPEQLLAVGWSACFLSSVKYVATKMKVELPVDPSIDAEVDLWAGADGYSLRVRLNVHLPRVDPEVAHAILEAAHNTCPYSKATRGNIDVAINLV